MANLVKSKLKKQGRIVINPMFLLFVNEIRRVSGIKVMTKW